MGNAFFWPHDALGILQTLQGGMSIVDEMQLVADPMEAAALLGDQFQALEDYLSTQVFVRLSGTADGSGNATIPHGITSAFTLVLAQCFYKGASATVFTPATVATVDATNVNVTGAGASKPVIAHIVISVVPPGW